VAHLDQVGFALTLPTSYSWSVVGQPVQVDYEAPQGRRVNGMGAYFTHGPAAGAFYHETYVRFPLPQGVSPELAQALARASPERPALTLLAAGKEPLSAQEQRAAAFAKRAEKHQVQVADFGIIDGEVLVAFIWKISGRPEGAPPDWRRERPLYVVLDNYSVHKGAAVQQALPAWNAAEIYLIYLPAYCPELSGIEPLWQTIKHHEMPKRSFAPLGELKEAVDTALAQKRAALHQAAPQ
jgi:hypothetical protein